RRPPRARATPTTLPPPPPGPDSRSGRLNCVSPLPSRRARRSRGLTRPGRLVFELGGDQPIKARIAFRDGIGVLRENPAKESPARSLILCISIASHFVP